MGLLLRRAQTGVEFMVFAGIVMFICIAIIGGNIFYLKELRSDDRYSELKEVGDVIRGELYMAASVEDGYFRSFFLRNDTSYSIVRVNKSLAVSTPDNSYLAFVEIDWTGNLTPGWNNISKVGGVIRVN